jgi:REP element-mobilizing transposase RayT
MRKLRFVPEGGSLVHVTCRTLHARFLLRPSDPLNDLIVGILARAKRLYPLGLCAAAWVSNHYHMLLDVADAKTLASFMQYVQSNVAREAGRMFEWKEHFWSRRYQSILVSNEEAAQMEVFTYILGHGVKEGLVERVLDWPGVHCAKSLLTGDPLTGVWFDRTKESAARRRGEDFDKMKYATREVLTFDPLPCWAHLTDEQRKRRVADVVAKIDADAAARIAATGITPPGPVVVRNQRPHDVPNRPKRSPAPLFHVATKAMRREMWEAYAWFVGEYRQAAEKLKAGDRLAAFPPGSFPPALPFVPA